MPWVDASHADVPVDELAKRAADQRRAGLQAFGLGERELADYAARSRIRVITPGADAGERASRALVARAPVEPVG